MKVEKFILKKVNQHIDNAQEGYEMGCLISSEFTPAPDLKDVYNTISNTCKQYNFDIVEFYRYLQNLADKWNHPTNPPYQYWEPMAAIEKYHPTSLK